MKLCVLGGKGNGLVIAASIERSMNDLDVAFFNDVDDIGKKIGDLKAVMVEGKTEDIYNVLKNEKAYVISGYGGFSNPKATLERLHSLQVPKEKWFTYTDPTSVIPFDYCEIGVGVFIGPLVQMSANSKIGDHTSIFGNAFVGHDTVVGEFCHIASNAVLGARINVGKGVHVGLNSTIIEDITIGDYSVIGAGSVVVKDVPPNTFVVGNPAKFLKSRRYDEK